MAEGFDVGLMSGSQVALDDMIQQYEARGHIVLLGLLENRCQSRS